MKYLMRERGQSRKAHLWTGQDTMCRMWSTGGLKHKPLKTGNDWLILDDVASHEICAMCQNVAKRKAKPSPVAVDLSRYTLLTDAEMVQLGLAHTANRLQ